MRYFFKSIYHLCVKLSLSLSFRSAYWFKSLSENKSYLCSVRIVGDALRNSVENSHEMRDETRKLSAASSSRSYFNFKQWFYESSRYGERLERYTSWLFIAIWGHTCTSQVLIYAQEESGGTTGSAGSVKVSIIIEWQVAHKADDLRSCINLRESGFWFRTHFIFFFLCISANVQKRNCAYFLIRRKNI